MPIVRRKRLPNGGFGDLEKVFEGETEKEKIVRLETENLDLKLALVELAEANSATITETQLAIAELAELLAGGSK